MQSLINTFLRPQTINTVNPAIITLQGTTILRKDHFYDPLTISLYSPKKQQSNGVILYCHSFGSNKHQSECLLPFIVKNHMKLVAFNFLKTDNQGHINNENGNVTFGYHQSQQIEMALEWIKEQQLGPVILWGRSMGAVAVLRSQIMKPTVTGIILDSPYQSLKEAIRFMIYEHTNLPGFLIDSVYLLFKSSIQQSLGFTIQSLDLGQLLKYSHDVNIPCLFISSKSDTYFGEATQSLYHQYYGLKELVYTQNAHSAPRQNKVLETALSNMLNMIKTMEKRTARKKVSNSLKQQQNKSVNLSLKVQEQTSLKAINKKIRKPMQTLKVQNISKSKRRLEFQPIKQTKIIPQCFGFCSTIT